MPVYKAKKPSKDGKIYFFKTNYTDVFGKHKQKSSKLFKTKTEAREAELQFLNELNGNHKAPMEMTFEDLYLKFREFQDDKIRDTTKKNYENKLKHITPFLKIKCKNYSIEHYEKWKKDLNKNPELSTSTKNDILKFWKSILNYGRDWFGFEFNHVYRKMTNFNNPNEMRKEMDFYTYDEFKQFIACEDDLYYRCLWEVFYYCGLRRGEGRGLQWSDIDFEKKLLHVTKQVISDGDSNANWHFGKPKTNASYRTIPICDALLDDLKKYYDHVSKYTNFTKSFFVLGKSGGTEPFSPTAVRDRKKEIAEKAKLKVIRLHDFRHSCASLLIHMGANITLVSKFLGHSKIEETLNTYTHMFKSAMDNVVNLINDINEK